MKTEIETDKAQIRIFPSHNIERGNGKPGYNWHQGYSQKLDNGSVTNAMTLEDWRAIAKRDGALLIQCKTEAEATLPKL